MASWDAAREFLHREARLLERRLFLTLPRDGTGVLRRGRWGWAGSPENSQSNRCAGT
jgi:hypothetical protein